MFAKITCFRLQLLQGIKTKKHIYEFLRNNIPLYPEIWKFINYNMASDLFVNGCLLTLDANDINFPARISPDFRYEKGSVKHILEGLREKHGNFTYQNVHIIR